MLRIWVADERLPLSISSLANSSLVNSLGRKVSRFSPKKKELCHKLQSPTTKLLCGANFSAAFPCAIHAISYHYCPVKVDKSVFEIIEI